MKLFLRGPLVSVKRYTQSDAQIRREWARHMRAARKKRAAGVDTPDNSESWLNAPPRSIGDLIRISDEVARLAASGS